MIQINTFKSNTRLMSPLGLHPLKNGLNVVIVMMNSLSPQMTNLQCIHTRNTSILTLVTTATSISQEKITFFVFMSSCVQFLVMGTLIVHALVSEFQYCKECASYQKSLSLFKSYTSDCLDNKLMMMMMNRIRIVWETMSFLGFDRFLGKIKIKFWFSSKQLLSQALSRRMTFGFLYQVLQLFHD